MCRLQGARHSSLSPTKMRRVQGAGTVWYRDPSTVRGPSGRHGLQLGGTTVYPMWPDYRLEPQTNLQLLRAELVPQVHQAQRESHQGSVERERSGTEQPRPSAVRHHLMWAGTTRFPL